MAEKAITVNAEADTDAITARKSCWDQLGNGSCPFPVIEWLYLRLAVGAIRSDSPSCRVTS